MRPSGVTPVASTMTSPAPESAMLPRCTRCQSVIEPSMAEYWHIGETWIRFGNSSGPTLCGVKSLGSGNLDVPLLEDFAQVLRERDRARLVAVQAERVGSHRHALAGKTGDVALLDH